MSAIAGLWHLGGRSVAPAELQRMLQCLSHRGPDGEGSWYRGELALGHRLLHTTPESLGETLPLVGRGDRLALTADARIDNRQDLLAALAGSVRPARDAPDSELIMAAYRTWGVHCVAHLVGDFAFALWDEARRHLFCARDHFGVKPFFYHHQPGRLFAFATEIKGILALPEVPRRLNETRVADYLQSSFDDQEITFYADIARLPPAHTLLVEGERLTLQSYWSPDPDREVRLGSDRAYAEAFRALFTQAVRCRLRSAFPVGSSLSGGLDSSSIVCTARDLLRRQARPPLRTFSLLFNDLPECDESPFIEAVLDGGDLVPHRIRGDRLSPLEELDRYLTHEDGASWGFNMCLHWAMHRSAAEHGVRVFLDGLGGDEVVCHGIGRLPELARSGRLLELTVSVFRLGRHFGQPPLRILRRHAIRPLLPPAALRLWAAGRRSRPPAGGSRTVRPLVSAAFADRVDLEARIDRLHRARPGAPASLRGSHYLALLAGITSAGFESIDPVAAAFSLEPRYPFYDRRLVEFCLALPAEQKLRWGWSRFILRQAMAGTLPERVRLRGGKANLSAQFNEGFLAFERERIEAVVHGGSDVIAPYVDVDILRELYREYSTGGIRKHAESVWHPVMLAIWLEHAGFGLARYPGTVPGAAGGMTMRGEAQIDMKAERKPYTTPRLTVHGDVATLTQQSHGQPGCDPSRKECGGGDGNSRLTPWGSTLS
jgi:asparagine synthase (glutamine-hydrolysing)